MLTSKNSTKLYNKCELSTEIILTTLCEVLIISKIFIYSNDYFIQINTYFVLALQCRKSELQQYVNILVTKLGFCCRKNSDIMQHNTLTR